MSKSLCEQDNCPKGRHEGKLWVLHACLGGYVLLATFGFIGYVFVACRDNVGVYRFPPKAWPVAVMGIIGATTLLVSACRRKFLNGQRHIGDAIGSQKSPEPENED